MHQTVGTLTAEGNVTVDFFLELQPVGDKVFANVSLVWFAARCQIFALFLVAMQDKYCFNSTFKYLINYLIRYFKGRLI